MLQAKTIITSTPPHLPFPSSPYLLPNKSVNAFTLELRLKDLKKI